MEIIFRNDDVSMASNVWDVHDMYKTINNKLPDAEIWSAVTVFSKGRSGPVNPKLMYSQSKDNPFDFFYDVDSVWRYKRGFGKLVSHGLFHVDHSRLDFKSAEMSILGSCKFLETDIFIPPYGRVNDAVIDVCKKHGIKLELGYPLDGWKSLEFNKFDPTHEKWYFHSWRYTPETFKMDLEEGL